MRCPNCKREIENDSFYCEHCGYKLRKSKWPIFGIAFAAAIINVIVVIIMVRFLKNWIKDDDSCVFFVEDVSFTMKKVEGGSFIMGATYEQESEAMWWEKPTHQVTLDSYYIGETEVTQTLWEAVMRQNPSSFKGDNLPVDCVSWDDCVEFCCVLSQKTGKKFRLPTEAEWEFAARGGNKSSHYKYPGSDYPYEVAWCIGVSDSIPHPVKTKKPNELGIYDMAGNVWEWCSDYWSANYANYHESNPQGPSFGEYRVHRGGGWLNHPIHCRISYRYKVTQSRRNDFRGFRLVMDCE